MKTFVAALLLVAAIALVTQEDEAPAPRPVVEHSPRAVG